MLAGLSWEGFPAAEILAMFTYNVQLAERLSGAGWIWTAPFSRLASIVNPVASALWLVLVEFSGFEVKTSPNADKF